MLELRVLDQGTVQVRGRLDASEADGALATLDQLPGPVALDCSELEYISSAGISVIMRTLRRLKSKGSHLSLTGLSPRVRSVFVYAGLDKVLDIR